VLRETVEQALAEALDIKRELTHVNRRP
jgi:hypothetical protein